MNKREFHRHMQITNVTCHLLPFWYFHHYHKLCSSASTVNGDCLEIGQDAQLLQKDRAAGCVSFGQKWKTGTGRQYFTNITGLSSTTVT